MYTKNSYTYITDIKTLVFNGKAVGMRLYCNDLQHGAVDVTVKVLKGHGVHNFQAPPKVELRSVNGLIISQEEINGKHVEDVSSDKVKREYWLAMLAKSPYSNELSKSDKQEKVYLNQIVDKLLKSNEKNLTS